MPRDARQHLGSHLRLFIPLMQALLLLHPAEGSAQDHAIWGRLEPGRYPVGFSVEYSRDPSRIELPEVRPDGTPETRPIERLMQVAFWYPARDAAGGEPISLGDYIALQESGLLVDDRRDQGVVTDQQRRDLLMMWATWGIMTGVDLGEWQALQSTAMRARRDAQRADGPFPLILLLQGASGSIADQMLTAEYLASYGYVVVTVPSRGPEQTFTRWVGDERLTESMLRDAEYALARAAARPEVDRRRLGVLGWSRGGLVSILVGMTNPSVDAVVGVDPSLGALLTASPWFDAARLRVPLLMFLSGGRRPPPVLDQLPYADIRMAGMGGLHHVDFGALGMIHTSLGVRNQYINASDEHIRASIEWVHRQALAFLDAHVRDDTQAAQRFEQSMESPPDSVTVSRRLARPAPPATAHLAELAWRRGGITQVAAIVREGRDADPAWQPFPEGFLNASAYRLIEFGRIAEAVHMARLNAELFPESANAYDTLGEMLTHAGERDAAIAAYERSLDLDPENDNARERLRVLRDGPRTP